MNKSTEDALMDWTKSQREKLLDALEFNLEEFTYTQKEEKAEIEFVYLSETQIIIYFDTFLDEVDYRINISDINSYEDVICIIKRLNADRAWMDLKIAVNLIEKAEQVLASKNLSVITQQKQDEWKQKLNMNNLFKVPREEFDYCSLLDEETTIPAPMQILNHTRSRKDNDEFILAMMDSFFGNIQGEKNDENK